MRGRLTAKVHRQSSGGARMSIRWPIERDGRMLEAGTTILSADGGLLTVARAIWIERRDAAG